MKLKLYRKFVELSNHPLTSSILRNFTSSTFSRYVNRSFVKTYKIDENEMEKSIDSYQSLQELFSRKLREGSRPIDEDPSSIVSPVDGVLTHTEEIDEHEAFTVKGQTYDLSTLLGSEELAERYIGGTVLLFYLSPQDYHRIHSPVTGEMVKRWALGSRSAPVNPFGLKHADQPLSKNYRLMTELEMQGGKRVNIAKVGAMNVNSIQVLHKEKTLHKGEEFAFFSFGSSVLLLFEKGTFQNECSHIQEGGKKVRQGERIGSFINGISET
ncbi:phosphatidylserine decarboxylase [Texcoconibacillus texcoconensis]|uniref:phosphatidylserine decarboxylase n=1 Tax=Texcoconibacillus texcoconensis TaxID=1095777 RepID=A0A840QRS2_9BACI|nr:phosphatidylserine decarboxylase [Texcoconibacillus texcoconensis]